MVNTCFYTPIASQYMHAECSTSWPEICFAVVIFYPAVPKPALALLGSTARNAWHGEAVGASRDDGQQGYTLTPCPHSPRALGMGQPSLAQLECGTHQGWAVLCGISHISSPIPCQGAQRPAPQLIPAWTLLPAQPIPAPGTWEPAEPTATSQVHSSCWGPSWH